MQNLSLKTQNTKGGAPQYKEKIGSICAIYGDVRILVDNYTGFADTYQQREQPIIDIQEDGKMIFSGTVEELKTKLKA
tara:strand:+ start:784 stop:1017 length:234 start_codon:yes stop_codon:yes gene_type:complete